MKWSRSKIYKEVQILLKFVNFYRRFIHRYFVIIASLIDLLKDNERDEKSKSLKWIDDAKRTFQKLRDIFIFISLLIYYDSAVKMRVKINVSNFAVARILSQQNDDIYWRSMTFWSRKMISTEQNYKTYDQKLLIIIITFKQWRYYWKSSAYLIKIWSNHNNFKEFIK